MWRSLHCRQGGHINSHCVGMSTTPDTPALPPPTIPNQVRAEERVSRGRAGVRRHGVSRASSAPQWWNRRVPVQSMTIPWSLAAAMTSSFLRAPPG